MIWGILGIGLLLRLISLNQSLWLDEGINIMAAKSFSLWGILTQYAVADFHPPGWFAVLWVFGKVFGYSEIALRMPSVLFGVITIYLVYLIGKRLVSKKVGLLAALLLSINPLHIYYSQEARMYSLAALAVSLNMLFFINLIKGNTGGRAVYILSNFLVLMSDYIAYFIFPAQLVLLLSLKKREIIKEWIAALVGALLLAVVWLPIFLRQLDVGASASANLPTWKFVNGAFDFKTIPLTFVKIIIGRISLADKLIYAALLLPTGSLFAFLLWRGAKRLDNLPKKLLLFWVIMPILIATAISFVIPVFSYFRVLYIVPGFLILLSVGILSFENKFKKGFLAAVIMVEFFCALAYLLIPANQREDWKGLVDYFNNIQPSIILFESSGTLPPFEYYSRGTLNARGALKDFPAKDESAVEGLGDLVNGIKELYLVDYMVQVSDPDRLVAKKLTGLGYKEADIKDFHGVGFVYHYVKDNKI